MTPLDGFSARRRIGAGALVVLLLGALGVTVGLGVWRSATTPVEAVPGVVSASGTASPSSGPDVAAGELYVHVHGAVREPGLYVLAAGARVVDAVSAAGGLADDADPSGVNLARPVADGEQLAVPRVGEAPPADVATAGPGTGAETGGAVIDLNAADQAALESLPRIGPALAGRILAWRDENGPFTSVEELLAVPGIGDAVLAEVRPLVRV